MEVSEAVYHAYHKEREAKRYQNKLIHQFKLSLERFQDDGVNVEFLITCFQQSTQLGLETVILMTRCGQNDKQATQTTGCCGFEAKIDDIG